MITYIYIIYIPIIWPKNQDLSWWNSWFQPDMLLHPWLFFLWRYRYWSKPSNRMNIHLPQCEAPKIAKLVYNSNNYGLWMFMVFITIVTGANLNQLTSLWGLTLQLFWCSPGVRFRFLTPISQKKYVLFALFLAPDISWCWGISSISLQSL